jgi:hypothetical protein
LAWLAPQAQPLVVALLHRPAGRLPDLRQKASLAQLGCHLLRITAPRRAAGLAVAPEQPQQPAARCQQPAGGGDVLLPMAGIDGAEAGVLDDAAEAAGSQARRRQGLPVEQIGLQPLQAGAVLAMEPAGRAQRFATEIQADGREAELFEQGNLMAASTARHQHPARCLGRQRMAAQELGQRWGGLPQLPAVTAFLVALVPVACSGAGGLIGGAHRSSLAQALAAADTPDLNAASVEGNESIAIKRTPIATLTIRNLDDNTKAQLRLQAAASRPISPGWGGVELKLPDRAGLPQPPDFSELAR